MTCAKNEIKIVRELAKEIAEISALPVQNEKKRLWLDHNMRRNTRPLVILGDIPWNEMNVNEELTCQCEELLMKRIETDLRRTLYRWHHMAGDMVVEDYINLHIPFKGLDYGLKEDSEKLETDATSEIASRHFFDQLKDEEDIEKIKFNNIFIDTENLNILRETYHDVFNGILQVREQGAAIYATAWDLIVSWHSVDNTMLDMMDRPEFIHKIMRKITDATLGMIDQLEALKMMTQRQEYFMFAPSYYEWDTLDRGSEGSAKNAWTVGVAQILGSVSKTMHDEFERPYAAEIFKRFGNVCYGCCEPLHDRIEMVRKMPNVRKISISPWANPTIAAENIGNDYVMARKPNPAFIASMVDWDVIRKDLWDTKAACEKTNTPLEYILKDISTVQFEPQRLWQWIKEGMKIAME